jgi:hypothetical protein
MILFGGIQLLRPVFVGRGVPLLIIGEEFRQRPRFPLLPGRLCFNGDQAQRLRQPARAVEYALSLLGQPVAKRVRSSSHSRGIRGV